MNVIKTAVARLFATKPHRRTARKALDAVKDFTGHAARDTDGALRVHARPTVVDDTWFRPTNGSRPTDMPVRWRMWDATGTPEIHENLTKTQTLPKIPADPYAVPSLLIELSYSDSDAAETAAAQLRDTNSIDAVLRGLVAYVNRVTSAPVYA
jgi:hypothetical protein